MATVPETTSIGDHGSFGHELDKPEASAGSLLSGEMLARFESRAATYDRENRFFDQDFEELRATGYLRLPVPVELGGAGFTLAQMGCEQRRLAYYAPATALAVNMHIYWVGLAADTAGRAGAEVTSITTSAGVSPSLVARSVSLPCPASPL